MEIPQLLAFLVMAKADGLTPEEVLDGIRDLARGETPKPQPRTALEWEAYHSQRRHDAYVAWLHSDD